MFLLSENKQLFAPPECEIIQWHITLEYYITPVHHTFEFRTANTKTALDEDRPM